MKTLSYTKGNLLKIAGIEVIGHQANCQNTFGAGIAKSISEMYPDAFAADCVAHRNKKNVLGNFSVGDIPRVDKVNKHGSNISKVYNLYGQHLGRGQRNTNYEALYSALEKMHQHLSLNFPNFPVVGLPYLMGCGLGGGDWRIVSRLIEVAFDGYDGEVMIVEFDPTK